MSDAATTFYLIRHASHDWLVRGVAGRRPGVDLNPAGLREAEQLAERLAGVPLHALYCSPLERTRQTAGPLAARLNLPVNICEEALEVDFGVWSGLEYPALDSIPGWSEWNTFRSHARPPGGESMLMVQARIVGLLHRLAAVHPGQNVAIVTHGDVIRAALLHYCGIPLDFILRLEVSPASVNIIQLDRFGPRILKINDTGPLTG